VNDKKTNDIFENCIEQLARLIHDDYLKEMQTEGKTGHPSAVRWESLPEEFKESNRAQARSFGEKLNMVGLAFDAGEAPKKTVGAFNKTTILLLAQNEHIRWMQEKLANGWVFAPVRDNDLKHHPLLIPYEKLPPVEKHKNEKIIKNIIPLLNSIGLRVYRAI